MNLDYKTIRSKRKTYALQITPEELQELTGRAKTVIPLRVQYYAAQLAERKRKSPDENGRVAFSRLFHPLRKDL
jgi:hypothetical protein